MVTLRCTQKLLRRMSVGPTETNSKPTTLLGDWYANILFSKPQLVLCVSERTLLSVVVPAKDIHSLGARFLVAVREILTVLGVPQQLIEQELTQMQGLHLGPTVNKRVLGSLNDFMFHLGCDVYDEPAQLPLQRSLRLGQIPCAPIGYKFPTDATLELFASGTDITNAVH